MRLIKLSIALLLLITFNGYGQIPHKERVRLGTFVRKNLSVDLFPDSTAFYAFNIQVTVDHENGYKPVVTVNNPDDSGQAVGVYNLEKYDYKPLMGKNKYIKFIIPIGVIVLRSKNDPVVRVLNARIADKISALFYYPIQEEEKRKLEYIGPLIYTIDKRPYH